MDILKQFTDKYIREDALNFGIGDTVKVYVKVKEGTRERLQIFEGTVIAKKHGGINESFTVRRVSYGVGVERVFPVNCPSVATGFVSAGRNRRRSLKKRRFVYAKSGSEHPKQPSGGRNTRKTGINAV